MFMTEKKAKDVWCPNVRTGGNEAVSTHNRPDGNYHCIASGCSQWRWVVRIKRDVKVWAGNKDEWRTEIFILYAIDKEHAEHVADMAMRDPDTRNGIAQIGGYCGLATYPDGPPDTMVECGT